MKRGLLGLMLVVCLGASPAYSNGYKILGVKSAKATAMGEAFIVQADDPTTIAFNPAGLAQLRGNQVHAQATLCEGYTSHYSANGIKTDNEDSWQAVPSFFITSDFGQENMAFGLGVSLPNGLSSEWAEDSFARYVSTYSDLVVADISPAIGFSLGDKWKLGAGVNFYYSEAQLESMVDYGALSAGMPNGMDVNSKLEGDGTAWGANVGAIYSFNEKHSAGLTYRLPFTVDYDGDMSIAGSATEIEATIDFPEVIVVGYAFKPNDKWKLEVNLDWTHWSNIDDISIDMSGQTIVQNQDMRNTIAYKFGSEYKYSEKLALRCGYIYNENATEDSSWRPSLPDTDIHFLTAGFGYSLEKVTIDAALQVVYYETRTIDNNVDFNEFASTSSIDGTYRTWAPCISVAATYRF